MDLYGIVSLLLVSNWYKIKSVNSVFAQEWIGIHMDDSNLINAIHIQRLFLCVICFGNLKVQTFIWKGWMSLFWKIKKSRKVIISNSLGWLMDMHVYVALWEINPLSLGIPMRGDTLNGCHWPKTIVRFISCEHIQCIDQNA